MSWIESLKARSAYDLATTVLGLQPGRMRSLGPCPACNADRRGKGDERLPIGMDRQGAGWNCHACNAKGDAVELAALCVLKRSSRDLDNDGWEQLRLWAVEHRLVEADNGRGGGGSRGTPGRKVQSVGDILGQGRKKPAAAAPEPAEPEEEAAAQAEGGNGRRRLLRAPGGGGSGESREAHDVRFSWAPGLVDECAVALWGESPEAIQARAYLLELRKLAEDSVRAFGLGLYVRDGAPVVVDGRPYITIPLYDKQRRPVNIRFRAVPVEGSCTYCSSPAGCTKCRNYRVCAGQPLPLFGAANLTADTKEPVIITEGELDVVAMHSYGFEVNVVTGTGGAGTWKDEWLDELEPYDNLIGLYDPDEKGAEGWGKAAAKLGLYRCSRAVLPAKDPNQCLMDGVAVEVIERAIAQATPMHGINLRTVDSYADQLEELINHPERLRGTRTGSDHLDKLVGGWRPGVVVVTGETGQGKTTWCSWIMREQAKLGVGAMVTSFEQSPIGTVQKFIRMEIGKDFTLVDAAARRGAMGRIGQLPLYVLDHYGQLAPDKLVEIMRYAKRRHGVTMFLIDHLGFLIDPDAKDERLAIQAVVRALALVANQMQITIFLIVHPSNSAKEIPGKFTRVTMRDLKGASAIRQDASDVLVVTRELPNVSKGQKVNRPWPQTRIYADKIRSEFGISGGDIALAYDPGSCIYADTWDETPAGAAGLLVPQQVKPPAPAGEGAKRKASRGGSSARSRSAKRGRTDEPPPEYTVPPEDDDPGA